VRIHDTDIRGWMLRLTLEGDPRLLRLAYEAGLGEHTASGFGMVAVAREQSGKTCTRHAQIVWNPTFPARGT
jgi:CRISPR/Cas system endoribonuclease Cas6 (RAMP superfamily)